MFSNEQLPLSYIIGFIKANNNINGINIISCGNLELSDKIYYYLRKLGFMVSQIDYEEGELWTTMLLNIILDEKCIITYPIHYIIYNENINTKPNDIENKYSVSHVDVKSHKLKGVVDNTITVDKILNNNISELTNIKIVVFYYVSGLTELIIQRCVELKIYPIVICDNLSLIKNDINKISVIKNVDDLPLLLDYIDNNNSIIEYLLQ